VRRAVAYEEDCPHDAVRVAPLDFGDGLEQGLVYRLWDVTAAGGTKSLEVSIDLV
jgi:hypothetical protein